MAKCIQVVGIPVRLSDDDAYEVVVTDGDGQYCPKHVWKEHCATDYYKSRNRSGLAKLVTNDKGHRVFKETETLHVDRQQKRGKE